MKSLEHYSISLLICQLILQKPIILTQPKAVAKKNQRKIAIAKAYQKLANDASTQNPEEKPPRSCWQGLSSLFEKTCKNIKTGHTAKQPTLVEYFDDPNAQEDRRSFCEILSCYFLDKKKARVSPDIIDSDNDATRVFNRPYTSTGI